MLLGQAQERAGAGMQTDCVWLQHLSLRSFVLCKLWESSFDSFHSASPSWAPCKRQLKWKSSLPSAQVALAVPVVPHQMHGGACCSLTFPYVFLWLSSCQLHTALEESHLYWSLLTNAIPGPPASRSPVGICYHTATIAVPGAAAHSPDRDTFFTW